jgi:hypothetical protein
VQLVTSPISGGGEICCPFCNNDSFRVEFDDMKAVRSGCEVKCTTEDVTNDIQKSTLVTPEKSVLSATSPGSDSKILVSSVESRQMLEREMRTQRMYGDGTYAANSFIPDIDDMRHYASPPLNSSRNSRSTQRTSRGSNRENNRTHSSNSNPSSNSRYSTRRGRAASDYGNSDNNIFFGDENLDYDMELMREMMSSSGGRRGHPLSQRTTSGEEVGGLDLADIEQMMLMEVQCE